MAGTGFVAASALLKKGAHVVLLNRKSSRAEEAEKKLLEEAPGSKVTSVECDLQSFENVRSAAAKLKDAKGWVVKGGEGWGGNNAGVMALEDKATTDGYDVQMQTNHLSHFLLTKELFPLLEKGDPDSLTVSLAPQLVRGAAQRGESRIVNHSSAARAGPSKPLDAKYLGQNGGKLGGNGSSMIFGGARWQRYHQTKLANVVFTMALQDRLNAANSKVKALVCAPGLASTNLQVTTNGSGGMSETWIMKYAQSAEDGTMPLLQCCAGSGVANGDFYEPTLGHARARARLTGRCFGRRARRLAVSSRLDEARRDESFGHPHEMDDDETNKALLQCSFYFSVRGGASGGLCCSCSRRATSVAAGPCPAAARGAPRMDGVREVLSSAALENHGDHWIEGMSMRPACASSATGGSFRSRCEEHEAKIDRVHMGAGRGPRRSASASSRTRSLGGSQVTFHVELDAKGRPRVRRPSRSFSKADGVALAGLESVHTGVVCAVDRPNRRGFIRVEELHELLGKDVLFRLAQLPGAEVGQRISFRVELEEGRPKVKEVLSGDGPPGEPFEKSEVCLVKLEGNFGPSGLCFGLSRAKLPEVQFIRPEQSQFWRRNEVHVGDRLMRIEGAHYTFVLGSEPERRPSELSEGLRQRPVELSFLRDLAVYSLRTWPHDEAIQVTCASAVGPVILFHRPNGLRAGQLGGLNATFATRHGEEHGNETKIGEETLQAVKAMLYGRDSFRWNYTNAGIFEALVGVLRGNPTDRGPSDPPFQKVFSEEKARWLRGLPSGPGRRTKFLNQEGFYCGTEDGDWGGTTEKALQLFLKDAGYDVDFKKGVRDGGKNTELFQEFLQDEDQDCKPDGSWGKKSAMALQNFLKNEEEKGFEPLYKGKEDGEMGGMTILALQKFLTQRGCNPGPLDSGLGKQTVVALQKFLSLQPDVLELKAVRRKKRLGLRCIRLAWTETDFQRAR
eukprot:g25688.t1